MIDPFPLDVSRYYMGINMTPERQFVADRMNDDDEGLTPRAFRCILRLADGLPLSANDVEWLTDGIEQPALAEMVGGVCRLTQHGDALVRAANVGAVEAIYAMTTMPELQN